MSKPWQSPQQPPSHQAQPFDLHSLLVLHKYLTDLAIRSATMETCLTHIETQLKTAITGIIVTTTQGPTQ